MDRRMLVATFLASLAVWCGAALQSASAHTFAVAYSFCPLDCGTGAEPSGGLIADSSGNLYGTTRSGGAYSAGAVFELSKAGISWKETVLYSFCPDGPGSCTDGQQPWGGLIMDTAGNLYGTTYYGGTGSGGSGGGTAFKLVRNATSGNWQLKTLYNFCGTANCSDGSSVPAGLSYANPNTPYDGSSPLFGVTYYGGANNGGTLFTLKSRRGKWSEHVLYSFCSIVATCADGAVPDGSVTLTSPTTIYGVTGDGGAGNVGVLYQLQQKATDWSETVVHSFCSLPNCTDGAGPSGAPTLDAGGNIYVTTSHGGANCPSGDPCGTLFKVAADGTQTVVHAFCSRPNCADGSSPDSGVVSDGQGNLYGTTRYEPNEQDYGSFNGGTAFKIAAGKFTVMHSFCARVDCDDGDIPSGPLVFGPGGELYGTTQIGGRYSDGEVFELSQ